jgi:histidine ammonia-lyase
MQVVLDGKSLTLEDVIAVARDRARVSVDPGARELAAASRARVEEAVADGRTVYGVNTGFGRLQDVRIPDAELHALQRNLILSHVAGVGPPLPVELVRAAMLLRANVLMQPSCGARPEVAEHVCAMLDAGVHPVVPEQGSVGASGDLAPLAHIAHAAIGEGTVLEEGRPVPAGPALAAAGIEPLTFFPKEALSFINGTQVQTAALALLVHDALKLWRTALGSAAMSLEALRGTPTPFDERLHALRPHAGQVEAAAVLRGLVADSEIRESHRDGDPRVQDAYSLRCTPQVLGAVRDSIGFAASTLDVELNAATDNPLVIGEEVLSGGNFHGQPVAMALDMLSIALATLAGIAERRIDRLTNPDLSGGLPAFLTTKPGVQSGLMMVQVTAAALVAEARSLCTPASVQSIPTEANQEDFVPMGMAAAFKARRILDNAQHVVAAELLCAAQGLEFLKPLRPGAGVQLLYDRVREMVPPLTTDRPQTPDVEALCAALRKEAWV